MFLTGSYNKDDELQTVSPFHFIPSNEPIKFVAKGKQGYIKYKQLIRIKDNQLIQIKDDSVQKFVVPPRAKQGYFQLKQDSIQFQEDSIQKRDLGIDWYDVLDIEDDNNCDLIDWYEVLEISSARIQHRFINEGKAPTNILHAVDFDPSINKEYYHFLSIK